jgi:tetratricopeptide (TPR) repeat protein
VHAGQVIGGRFEVEALAGSGGMADVYRALDRTTETRVAVKILRATGPEDLARLAREAQALARLTHPGIVRYVAHGTSDASEPFVAMEWVEGETLSRRLHAGPLPLTAAIKLGRALAAALGHAHEHGVVHRDVKPGNVVLRGGDVEDPILLDFGVARTGLAVGLTQLGTVIGTPRYMAPEQARGAQGIDARADVFALGALVFKCITGRAPFDGEDAIAVLAHLLFDDAPDVCELVPGVPRSVGDLLSRMLAKEPTLRFADGGAVMRAIDALDASEIPVIVAAPAPSGLTLRERRLLSLMVLTGKVDADVARAVANDFGGRAERLANGSVVVVVSGRENATELARVSARCALELRHALPDAPIVLATGRGDDVDDECTETMASDDSGKSPTGESTGTSRYSGVFERAAGLLRHEHAPGHGPLPIVIDDTTAGLLGADFDIARGKGPSPHALRGRASRAQYTLLGKPTPFVGRARELSSLLATWADVCEQGVARAILVVGEAGVGKSRLLYEMMAGLKAHEQPALTLRAKAEAEAAGSPFAALGVAVRREVGIDDDEDSADRWNKLAARVASVVPEGETHVAEFVAEVAGVRQPEAGEQVAAARRDPRLMGDRIRRAWQTWIRGEAARGPVLLVLEDFQWGDLPTVKLVEDMLRDLAEEPIFMLALARPEIESAFPNLWSRASVRLPLVGLPKKAAATFARAMLGGASLESVDRIVELASGNALYLEELVRSAAEGKTDAPESLLAILSAQVESLPDAERRVLRAGSVFGATFWTDGVCVLLGGEKEPNERVRAETNALLDSLGRREIVGVRAGSRLAGQRELDFRNALVRDVTYAMLTDEDKRLGHALAAGWLERAGEADPFVLAEHWERGAELDRALAEYTRSARRAYDACDYATVLDRVARAERCGASGDDLAELLVVAAEAQRWRGETRECCASASRAMELARPNSPTRFHALRLFAYASSFAGDIEGLARASRALVDCEPDDAALREWVSAMSHLGHSFVTIGQLADNQRIIERLEREWPRFANEVELMDLFHRAVGMGAYGLGDFTTFAEILARSAEIHARLGDVREAIIQTSNVGFAKMWVGLLDESLAAFAHAREQAVVLKLATLELNAMQNAAFIRLCKGELDEAVRGSREVLGRARIEAPRSMALAHATISRALRALGDFAQAESHAREARQVAPTPVVKMYTGAVLADALLGAGRLAEARAASDEALVELGAIASLAVGDLFALVVASEAREAGGDAAGARETILRAKALDDVRRAHLRSDAARSVWDADAPDSRRLRAALARLG